MKNKYDYIIIGSGLAGLTTALTLGDSGSIAVITKKNCSDSSTNLAQGGMAAMINRNDRAGWHIKDTLKAGDYHNEKKAVSFLIKKSREALYWLKKQGVLFEAKPSLEAGHRLARVFHTTDFTGQDIVAALLNRIIKNKQINIFENTLAIDLILKNKVCAGIFVLTEKNKIVPFFAKAIILATGGAGQVYQWTTNPKVVTGDGIVMAKRAGVDLADVEFVQFHPTALKYQLSPLFLLSERLRGEEARLVDEKSNRFVNELILRDKLSRSVYEKQKNSAVYLTMAHIDKKKIIKEFPNIYRRLKLYGFDLTKDRIPVTPAAHYFCGGVATDLQGRSSVRNLFAVGEVACTGVHGANRLASNSLLEAVVFGRQVSGYIRNNYKKTPLLPPKAGFEGQGKNKNLTVVFNKKDKDFLNKIETDLKKIMWKKVGIVRTKRGLLEALNHFENFKKRINKINTVNNLKINEILEIKGDIRMLKKLFETINLVELAIIITKAALARPKSLGAHYVANEAN